MVKMAAVPGAGKSCRCPVSIESGLRDMKRIKLTVAYDGTNYCGWQVQPNGITVQEVLNRALSELLKEEIHTVGASRTDAGVHARGNVAVFDTRARMPGDKIAFALNTRLPEDIRIQGSQEVSPEFHPRFTSTVKTYEYKILNRTFSDPTRRQDSMFWYGALDLEAMKEAAGYLPGTHDFKSFAAVQGGRFNRADYLWHPAVERGRHDPFSDSGNRVPVSYGTDHRRYSAGSREGLLAGGADAADS